MLDFLSLQKQLADMVVEQTFSHQKTLDKVAYAQQTLEVWSDRWKELAQKIARSRTSWLLAGDLCGPLQQRIPLPDVPTTMTAVATDGSQIFPDRHEISACHLINIGSVVLHYGSGERPLLTNHPRLFFRDHEIYRDWNGKRIAVNEEIISALRGALEIQELARLAGRSAQEHRQTAALLDGTLILWKLEGKPRAFQQEILHQYIRAFNHMKMLRVPFLGYISRPASADLINVLRVALCPEHPTNCDKCPYKGHQPELPCEPIDGVTDAMLFEELLSTGERSAVFQSASTILEEYGAHTVYFFYSNVGDEIARVEIPKWVADDPAMLQFVHAIAYDQAEKGRGYPVSLAEAHEQAVIRGPEREQFYRLLEQMYVREGLPVSLSRKSFKKHNVSI